LVDKYAHSETSNELVINLSERTYLKQGTDFERFIIRALLPDAKFIPMS